LRGYAAGGSYSKKAQSRNRRHAEQGRSLCASNSHNTSVTTCYARDPANAYDHAQSLPWLELTFPGWNNWGVDYHYGVNKGVIRLFAFSKNQPRAANILVQIRLLLPSRLRVSTTRRQPTPTNANHRALLRIMDWNKYPQQAEADVEFRCGLCNKAYSRRTLFPSCLRARAQHLSCNLELQH
jgi:hypothetical protein